MILLGIWGTGSWSAFFLVLFFFFPFLSSISKDYLNGRGLCIEAAMKGLVLSLWNHVTSFRFWCWDVLKSLQYSTSEESHSWALNTLVHGLYCLDGKMGSIFFFFLEYYSVALRTWEYFCLLFEILNLFFSIACDAKPFKYLNV